MDETLPNLDTRFLPPEHWQWEYFSRESKKGYLRRLRYGYALPQNRDKPPKAIIMCLPGLGDFSEKYFETAHWALENGFGFFVIDWVGQGLSTRYLKNPHKRHSAGFDEDIKDAQDWLHNHICPHKKNSAGANTPIVMLAHSMGGHIGLGLLKQEQQFFKSAAFSAPMWGIKAVEFLPHKLALFLTRQLSAFGRTKYAPGGTDWNKIIRNFPGKDIFSSDAQRGAVHNAWCLQNPELQVGGVTNGWLFEALKSCAKQRKPAWASDINIPISVAIAGKDKLVSNRDIRKVVSHLPRANIIELPNSQHEILMESDTIRDIFLEHAHRLFTQDID